MKKNTEMFVEIPKGSINKYEYNATTKEIKLDRVLSGSMHYPEEYGAILETLDYDGDPLDVICLTSYPIDFPCFLPIRIIGVLKMIDGGEEDDKILAVNAVDPRFQNINDLKKMKKFNPGKLSEISNFFLRYKELELKEVIIAGWGEKEEAEKILKNCQNLYEKYRELVELVNKGIEKKKKLVEILSQEKRQLNTR
jgi:inorganic pyrophosphatase